MATGCLLPPPRWLLEQAHATLPLHAAPLPTVLRRLTWQPLLAARAIEARVRTLACYVPPPGYCYLADNLYLPTAQAVPFIELLLATKTVPSQEDHLRRYWMQNAAAIAQLTPAQRFALACRVARTWLSLVADEHFASLCAESGRWVRCQRGVGIDLDDGADLLLTDRRGRTGAVRLYVDTVRARAYRARKVRRPGALPVFDLALPLDAAHRCGRLHLYHSGDIARLWAAWAACRWWAASLPLQAAL